MQAISLWRTECPPSDRRSDIPAEEENIPLKSDSLTEKIILPMNNRIKVSRKPENAQYY